jgi:hypothetical protein
VVKDEEEWVAADWVPAGTADAPIVDIQCHTKQGWHAISKLARNAGLKWQDHKKEVKKWVEIDGETCII